MIAGMLSLIVFATADIQYYNDPDWRAKKEARKNLAIEDTLKIPRRKSMDRRFSVMSNEI